jgi:hypothetical protein
MSIGYCECRLTESTYLPVAQASFIEEDTLAWRPTTASSFLNFLISYFLPFGFTNRAKLPYLWLIFEAPFGFLQPARMADSKSPEHNNIMFRVIALIT